MFILPSSYKPLRAEDFIGSARRIANRLDTLLAAAMPSGKPLALLFLGRPGIGKTALANYLMHRLQCDKWHTTILNGTQVKIEVVEELAASLRYKELFGSYRLIRIEEVDKVPTVAQVRFLTLLDDMPPFTAVVATSNCSVKDLEERFQTRFIVFEVAGPTDVEIIGLLEKLCAGLLTKEMMRGIATFACGNVRQALLDADKTLIHEPRSQLQIAV